MMPKDVDSNRFSIAREPEGPPRTPPQGQAPPPSSDPFSVFYAARDLSYEELTERRRMQVEMQRIETDKAEVLMTDAMRQANLDTLIAVANYEIPGLPGMNPEQALVILKETLDRPQYDALKHFYPGLQEAVDKRFEEIKARRLPGRKEE